MYIKIKDKVILIQKRFTIQNISILIEIIQ